MRIVPHHVFGLKKLSCHFIVGWWLFSRAIKHHTLPYTLTHIVCSLFNQNRKSAIITIILIFMFYGMFKSYLRRTKYWTHAFLFLEHIMLRVFILIMLGSLHEYIFSTTRSSFGLRREWAWVRACIVYCMCSVCAREKLSQQQLMINTEPRKKNNNSNTQWQHESQRRKKIS